jgi:predicted nucleotidyltransferase
MGATKYQPSDPIGTALFGVTRQAVLRLLFGHTDRRFYQRQIIRSIRLGSGTVQRELERLAGARILTRTVEGRQTYFQANRNCPVFNELHGLIRKTFGVAQVLQSGLTALAGKVQLAFIYGSMATGSETTGSDVDVMVVGERVSMDDVVSALTEAQRDLGREVNPSLYRTEEFCRKIAQGQHFLSSVVSGQKIFLIGDENELARLAQIRMAQGAQDESAGNRRPLRRRRPRSESLPNAGPGS